MYSLIKSSLLLLLLVLPYGDGTRICSLNIELNEEHPPRQVRKH